MATLPRDGYPAWASTLRVDPLTGVLNKEQPDIDIQNEGLVMGEPIKRDHLNWQFDSIARWIEYQDLALLEISIRLDALDGKGTKEHITVGIGELHSTSELSAITELHS